MLRWQFQGETTGIEFGEPCSKGDEQITFQQHILHRTQTRNTAQAERMIGCNHTFTAGGGEDRRLQQLSQLLNEGPVFASTGAKQENRLLTGSNLLRRIRKLLRQQRRNWLLCRHRVRHIDGSMKKVMRYLDKGRTRQRPVKYLRSFSNRV